MRKILIAAILIALPLPALAADKVDILVVIRDYDLRQGGGEPNENTMRASVVSGSEKLLKISKEFLYNKEFNKKGRPTKKRLVYLGIQMPIYVREQEGTIYYLGRVELCEREDPSNEFSVITKSATSFHGQVASGNTAKKFDARAPGDKRATVEITLTKL